MELQDESVDSDDSDWGSDCSGSDDCDYIQSTLPYTTPYLLEKYNTDDWTM